jgi:hypothetical protein
MLRLIAWSDACIYFPTFNDRPNNLPFVEAIYKELLRWRVVFRLDVPHSVMENERA